ncbi:hypothetical protein EJB05_35836, partial [Eragrostis curvula]
MAEICCEEAKSAPAPASASAVTALARRRPRVEMARPALAAADQGGARGGKRRRVACAGPRPGPRYGVTAVCGLRPEMEDTVTVRPDFLQPGSSGDGNKLPHHFFGVFDGHGCSHPDRPDELERIKAAGGRVIYWDGARVLGVLAMSRAIGERRAFHFKIQAIIIKNTFRRSEPQCLV